MLNVQFMLAANTPQPAWTIESIAARRATGDVLVRRTEWFVSYDTSSERKGTRFSCYRLAPGGGFEIVERDVRHDDIFTNTDEAECYALNAGRLYWYSERKAVRS